MNKLSLILAILFLSGCQTIEKYSQCDNENNYVHIDSLLFNEYNLKNENNMIKNYYILNDYSNFCSNESCLGKYNLDFIEYKFVNFKLKSGKVLDGYYEISTKKIDKNDSCYYKKNDNTCYIIKEIKQPISQYKLHLYGNKNVHYQKFIDTTKNETIIDISYQVYSVSNPLSGIGSGGICDNNFKYNKKYFLIPNISAK